MEKLDNSDIDELAEYRKTIMDKVNTGLKSGICEIQKSVNMLSDLSEIVTVLQNECKDRQQEIKSLKKSVAEYSTKNDNLKQRVAELEKTEEKYNDIQDKSVEIAKVLIDVNNEKEKLDKKREKLLNDIKNYEKGKKSLKERKEKAEGDAKQYKEERNDFKRKLDEKTNALDKATGSVTELNECMRELNNRLTEVEKDKQKYKDYAIAQDKKIFDYFKNEKKDDLKRHFDTYLNAEDKIEERMELFGEKGVFIEKEYTPDSFSDSELQKKGITDSEPEKKDVTDSEGWDDDDRTGVALPD